MDQPKPSAIGKLSHVDPSGAVRMVDVSEKPISVRTAAASAVVTLKPEVLDQLLAGRLPKGEALSVAKLAGIQAAKMTGQLIPLCHPLPIDFVDLQFDRRNDGRLNILATVKTTSRTGAEMEALTAATVAALTVYDMAKAADREITIGPVRLERKSGGRSGDFNRPDGSELASEPKR